MKMNKSQNLKSIPTGYKQTEVGIIPVDWKVSNIGDLCVIFGRIGFRGYTKADIVSQDQGVLSISPSNIIGGRTSFTHGTYITRQKYEESPEIKIYEDDILLVKTGSTYGKIALVKNLKEDATLNPQVVVFKRLKSPAAFLACIMQSDIVQNQIEETIVGGAIPTLSQKVVLSYKIPLPAPREQLAIANVLSDTDALIIAIEQLIVKKKAIKTAFIQQLLTGRTRLPQYSKHPDGTIKSYKHTELGLIPVDWIISTIDECANKVGSGKTPTGGSSVYTEAGHPFVRSQNIGWGKLELSDIAYISDSIHKTFPGTELAENDVLLNITGASIGRCALSDFRIAGGNVNQHVCIIRVNSDKLIPKLLVELMNADIGQNQIDSFQAGGNREGLNFSQVRQLRFAIPKSLEEQNTIATILSDMDAELTALERKLAKFRDIKQGMMQQLLTGRIRLPLEQQP